MHAAAFALILYFHFWGEAERHRFEARVEALRAAGQPVRYEDLETPAIADAENGAKPLAEAARMLVERKGREPFPFDGVHLDEAVLEAMSPEEREGRRAYLRSLKPCFDLLADAATRPRWRLDREWKKGSTAPEKIDWLQDASLYLIWKATLDPEGKGRAECAAEATLVLIGIGERWRAPFAFGEQISRVLTAGYPVRILRIACGSPSIGRTVHPGFDATKFLRLVDGRLAKATPIKGPSRAALAEERVWTLWAVEAFGAGRKTDIDKYLPLRGRLLRSRIWRPLLYRDANRALDVFEEAIALAETSPEEAQRTGERLKATRATKDPTLLLTRNALASAQFAFAGYARDVAMQRLTRVAMALMEHRQQKGAWPESLDALGEMPLDPYSGKPFVYERLEGCYARVRAARRTPREGADPWDEWEALEAADLAWIFKD